MAAAWEVCTKKSSSLPLGAPSTPNWSGIPRIEIALYFFRIGRLSGLGVPFWSMTGVTPENRVWRRERPRRRLGRVSVCENETSATSSVYCFATRFLYNRPRSVRYASGGFRFSFRRRSRSLRSGTILGENGPRDPNPAAVRTGYADCSTLRFCNVSSGPLPLFFLLSSMALPVMTPERRRSARISLSALAYITFDSNCGGIVVNISDEGLCFHTIAPIERSDTIRFWFSADGKRIEAQGRLIWTDETRKTGGLRFNALSAEASRQIRNWIVQSSDPFAATRQIAAQPPLDAVAHSGVSKSAKGAMHGSGTLREWSRWIGTLARWGEFSRGLATGILIAVVVAAIFLFHTYKHRIGESLIFLGERFGATPHSETASRASTSASPSPQATGSTSQRHTTAAALSPAAIPSSGLEEALVQPAAKAAKPAPAKPAPKPIAPAISFAPSTVTLPIIDFAAARPGLPPSEAGGTAQPESADRSADKTTVIAVKPTGNSSENAEDIAEINSGVPFGKYFDAGRFQG